MPIYEFRCKKCGHRFERMQRFSDPHPADCPDCKARGAVEQLISAPAAHFKGSGWYATDYAKKPAPAASGSTETKTETKSDGGSETKTETAKPDSSGKKSDKKPEKKKS